MGRPPVTERMEELKRGPWTPEEDIMLVSYIQEHGPGNWRLVPSNAGLQRCGKSCRLRWKNYLRPGIKRGNFTPEEDRVIIRYQGLLGNRWAAIAAHLPSRTDNDIKNYWHTHLKKNLGEVNGSGDERAQNYEGSKHNGDAAASGLDHMKAYCEAGNSMTTTPQNNELKKSVYDDIGILALKSIEKWLLDDHSAPFPQILSVPDPAPVPQVFPAQAPAAVPQVRSAPVSAVVSQVFPSPAPAPQVPPVLTPIEKWLLENSSAPVPPGIDQAGTGDQRALPAPFPPFLRALVSAPVPQVLRAQAPAPFPQVTLALEPFPQVTPAPAPAPASAPSSAPNMFAPFGHCQISFGPFY